MTLPPKLLVDVDAHGHPIGVTFVTGDGIEVPLPHVVSAKRVYANERLPSSELVLHVPIEERTVATPEPSS